MKIRAISTFIFTSRYIRCVPSVLLTTRIIEAILVCSVWQRSIATQQHFPKSWQPHEEPQDGRIFMCRYSTISCSANLINSILSHISRYYRHWIRILNVWYRCHSFPVRLVFLFIRWNIKPCDPCDVLMNCNLHWTVTRVSPLKIAQISVSCW